MHPYAPLEPTSSETDPMYIRPEEKIHILGWPGAVGKFIAHSLASMPRRPPIVLLHHREDLQKRWGDAGEAIVLEKYGIQEPQKGFEIQSAMATTRWQNPDAPPIYNLIVASKAYTAVQAVRSVAWRLRPESTVVFLQNGMGFLEEVNNEVFPNPENRPHYMLGIVTHGLTSVPEFLVKHHGSGSISLTSLVARPESSSTSSLELRSPPALPASSKYLLRHLTWTPALCALGIYPSDFLQLKFEKLAANAVINPLTALLGCRNGALLDNDAMVRLMRMLLAEISRVLRSLPEMRGLPMVDQRFSSRSLELYVVNVAKQTAENHSSMLQDMEAGRKTEIDYINGYIVRRGEEEGIRCVTNYMIVQMVKAKNRIVFKGLSDMVPIEGELLP